MIAARQIAFGRGAGAILPDGVIPIEYLESTGTQYIDTGIKMRGEYNLDITYQIVDASVYYGGIFSCRPYPVNHTASYTLLEFDRFDYGVGAYCTMTQSLDKVNFRCVDGSCYRSNELVKAGKVKDFAAEETAWLFDDRANSGFKGRIFHCSILNGITPVLDLIPVRVGSVGYMYDRVSGRLFGNDGTGVFVLGPDLAGIDIEYTAKDYVQDGLVAMWDGIENAGWGVHDDGATVWKDLVGGIAAEPINYKNNADFAFGWSDGFCKVRHCNLSISAPNITDVINSPQCTYEFALVRRDGNNRFYIVSDKPGLGSWQNAQNGFYVVKGANNIRTSIIKEKSFLLDDHRSLSAVFNNGYRVIFSNGVMVKEDTVTETVSPEITNLVGCGYRYDDFTTCADVNFVRIYNRALTAEEIAHNYEIDKVRFNLP